MKGIVGVETCARQTDRLTEREKTKENQETREKRNAREARESRMTAVLQF